MRIRFSKKFLWKIRLYRVLEFVFAMLIFTIFYVIQIPLLILASMYGIYRASNSGGVTKSKKSADEKKLRYEGKVYRKLMRRSVL